MVIEHRKFDLFEKTFIQKMVIEPPFEYTFPVSEQACFLYVLKGGLQFQLDDDHQDIPTSKSLLLNCLNSGKQMQHSNASGNTELVIVTFHSDVLKKIYDRDLPLLLQQPKDVVSNQSSERINNDFLVQKYIEGLLFYFENPSLVNNDILILKLKEIILLLSQTQNAGTVQLILSQLFSSAAYTFKQIIEAHLFAPVSVEELAKKCNMSVSSFKREFAKRYNDTPANYIRSKRLEKAAELLLASDLRVTDIAFDCGFNDLANFTKSFHDKYELSPSQYRLNGIAK